MNGQTGYKKLKRILKNISVILFVSLALSCCSGNNENEQSLTYWCSNSEYEIQFARIMSEKWNNLNKDTKIKFQPVNQFLH